MGLRQHQIVWSRDFSIKNVDLDRQHEIIFQVANDTTEVLHRLEQEPDSSVHKEELKKITMRLFHYIKTHFSDEEKFMKEIDFPLFEEHRKSHIVLTNQAKKLLAHSDNIKQFSANLETLVNNFVARHFAEEDLLLADFLNSALHINEAHFNLDQFIMLRALQNKNIYNEESYAYVCSCSLQKLRQVPKSIHDELESTEKILKCRHCGKVLVFIGDANFKENYQGLKQKFLALQG